MTLSTGALIALLLGAGPAGAHDTWLSPLPAAPDGSVQLLLTSGMAFPAPESAIAPNRLVGTAVRSGGKIAKRSLKTGPSLPTALALIDPAPAALAAEYTVELKPRVLELDAESVTHYLAELADDGTLRQRHEQLGQWRERYRKHARALRQVDGGFDPAFSRPDGPAFQLVLAGNPAQLRTGDPLGICAYRDGQPVEDLRIGLVYANHTATPWWVSDAEGCVIATVLAPGRIMARGILLEAAADGPDVEWESAFATYTFEVPHEAPAP